MYGNFLPFLYKFRFAVYSICAFCYIWRWTNPQSSNHWWKLWPLAVLTFQIFMLSYVCPSVQGWGFSASPCLAKNLAKQSWLSWLSASPVILLCLRILYPPILLKINLAGNLYLEEKNDFLKTLVNASQCLFD